MFSHVLTSGGLQIPVAELAAIVAGFWPSFFAPLGAGDFAHSLHGVTATLWIVVLATQSWLVSRGLVCWHRRVALGALVLLPVMILSALRMVAVMFANPQMPPFLPPLLAFIDLPSVAFLIVLVTLALRNARVFAPQVDFMMALHGSLITVELILVALIVSDRRAGERRLAYPLSLAFFNCIARAHAAGVGQQRLGGTHALVRRTSISGMNRWIRTL